MPTGYARRADGTYAKTVTFDDGPVHVQETLVRTVVGAFRVERSRGAIASMARHERKRALSLAAARRKKSA